MRHGKFNLNGTVFDCQATDEVVAGIQGAAEDYSLDINSPGGDVFAGLTIVNAIQNNEHKATANVHVMAASIAAIIALACDEVVVDETALSCCTIAGPLQTGTKRNYRTPWKL